MLKNLFNRGVSRVTESVATPAQPAPREFKATKKKKNTYIVQLNTMTMPGAFEWCDSTPLAVVKINGVETENARGGWMQCTSFPNPGASTIETLYHMAPEWRIIMGATASTIVEYLDKKSNEPVLILYPNGKVQSLVKDEDINKVIGTRLNHASRRDFIYQYNKIIESVEIVGPMINVRNKAMAQAPQHNSEAYAEFIAELDRLQIERANQIIAARQNKNK